MAEGEIEFESKREAVLEDGSDISTSESSNSRDLIRAEANEDEPLVIEGGKISQHWTDPPTGQVPKVLLPDGDSGDDEWSRISSNTVTWRSEKEWSKDEGDDLVHLTAELPAVQEGSKKARRKLGGFFSNDQDEDGTSTQMDSTEFPEEDTEDDTNSSRIDYQEHYERPRARHSASRRERVSREDLELDDDEPIFFKGRLSGLFGRAKSESSENQGMQSNEDEADENQVVPPSLSDDENTKVHVDVVESKSDDVLDGIPDTNLREGTRPSPNVMFEEDIEVGIPNRRIKISSGSNNFSTPEKGNTELSVRVLTGAAIAAACSIFFAIGSQTALALTLFVATLAVFECYRAFQKVGFRPATVLGVLATMGVVLGAYLKGSVAISLVAGLFVVFTFLWYLSGSSVNQGTSKNHGQERPVANIGVTLIGFGWIGVLASFGGLILNPDAYPNGHGVAYLVTAITLAVINDVGAFGLGKLAGSKGKHLFAPNISPNKTWEGFVGGTILTLVAGIFLGAVFHPWTISHALMLAIVISVVAPLGDLVESMLKRDLKLKDFGAILPGHGGILDRVDGILFALPATYGLLQLMHLS
ncbi:MAG: phosphatidate cytidylyltransferase [Acidimicrobiales bacterium]|nr:phosphatidate cytidylyltransferase [Acidimicrobiales bacterium]